MDPDKAIEQQNKVPEGYGYIEKPEGLRFEFFLSCFRCGVLVFDFNRHDQWHWDQDYPM